jgi:hypothetical protein
VIEGFWLAPANVHELWVTEELLAERAGWVVGDCN